MAQVPENLKAKIGSSRANPQEIADVVLQIIETPAGQRQLRYRVGPGGPGVQRINALTDEIQREMREAFGVTALAKFKAQTSGAGWTSCRHARKTSNCYGNKPKTATLVGVPT